MVQRQVLSTKPGILPIQPDHASDKLLGSLQKRKKRKNSTSGHHDGKKMKRSGSVRKCSDFHKISETQRQPMSPLPGKSLSLVGSAPTTPQKPSPNYMKSTTSSEARKEKERSPLISKPLNLDKKICSNSKATSAYSYSRSGNHHKPSPARNSTRISGFKQKTTARALTKAPSFKKCSKMGLCGEVTNVRKSTCSSTMKDSKFPPYLVLDDGGTEAEGTSVLKVCPYTYCSLNGHHHQPLPPLNCFLKAKRRSLKAQRSVKLGSLFPRKPDVVPAASETVGSSDMSQDETDFFVEIYATIAENEGIKIDSSQEDRKLVDEQNLIEEIPDSEGQPAQFGGSSYREEEQTERSFAGGMASVEEDDDKSSEATDMEWEQGHDSASQVDVEGNFCSKGSALFSEIKKPEIVELDDISSCCTEEVLAEELLRELFDEETETVTSSVTSEDGDSEKDSDEQQDDAFEAPQGEKGNDGDRDSMVRPIRMDSLEANPKPQRAENDCPAETVAQCLNGQLQLPNGEPDKSGNNGLVVSDSSTVCSQGDQDCTKNRILENIMDADTQGDSDMSKLRSIGHEVEECCNAEGEDCDKPTKAETSAAATNEGAGGGNGGMSRWARSSSKQERVDPCSDLKLKIGCRRAMDKIEGNEREFNPRDPNFLPIVPDPDAERVDLKHQTMDERKNSKEWMVDHALQEAVTKLASARRRKVALLVEAFETVSPLSKYEPRMRHSSPVFSPTTPRPIQACN